MDVRILSNRVPRGGCFRGQMSLKRKASGYGPELERDLVETQPRGSKEKARSVSRGMVGGAAERGGKY